MQCKKIMVRWLGGAMLSILLATMAAPAFAQDAKPLPVLPKDQPFAAFIDSHNVAVAKGATAEWRKMEGVALDATNKRLYIAITAIAKGMSDKEGDIQLPENPCGAILMAQLDDKWDIASLTPVVVGGPYNKDDKDYPCNKDAIANPDNVFVDAKGNLWIGEDTDLHRNQMLWMWNGKELKRFGTWPTGAEITGLRVEPNGTLFTNVQHPSPMNIYPYNRAVVGVVTGYVAGDDFTSIELPKGADLHRLKLASGDYQVLARVAEAIPGDHDVSFGEITDAEGIKMNLCNNPDGNMFLPTDGEGAEGYLYTNYECTPGGVGRIYIKQATDGKWSVIEGDTVDFSAVNGTWNNCNASVTPWNTAMTSEEYPADVEDEWTGGWLPVVDAMKQHLGKDANPYDYGYNVELIPAGGEDDQLGTIAQKRYAMGRFSKEMALVMPDSQTVYFGDDGTDRVLYKFVATTAEDLSEGTLYAAKLTQDKDTLNVKWIELGTGKDSDIEAAIRQLDSQFAAAQ
ncbi:MAG: DUF839 domain-containing protein [Chloroflexi bacterium]|nr:DUF839 domain-containing protein [Chloroflexota bacterium]